MTTRDEHLRAADSALSHPAGSRLWTTHSLRPEWPEWQAEVFSSACSTVCSSLGLHEYQSAACGYHGTATRPLLSGYFRGFRPGLGCMV